MGITGTVHPMTALVGFFRLNLWQYGQWTNEKPIPFIFVPFLLPAYTNLHGFNIKGKQMASKAIEKEIDAWVESCPLKRRSICDRPAIVRNHRELDRAFNKAWNELADEREAERYARLL